MVAAVLLAPPLALRGQANPDTSAAATVYVIGLAKNFGAAFYVFDGPDRDNNMANCGTARGAGLNAGLYLVCLTVDELPDGVRVGSKDTWVTVFERSGAPVLTFVQPVRTRKVNMEACKAVLEVPTHTGWVCRAGGARRLKWIDAAGS